MGGTVRVTRILLLTAGLVAALAGPAAAQQYPPGGCALALTVSSGPAGSTTVAATTNCDSPYAANVSVQLDFLSDPVPLTTVTADANGHFSTTVKIPTNATLGHHEIRSTGPGRDVPTLVLSAAFIVTPAGVTVHQGSTLAFTGSSNTHELVALGLAAVLVGGLFVIGARRRSAVRARISSR
jgi:LPXTG-motif cell wall-anchored protein